MEGMPSLGRNLSNLQVSCVLSENFLTKRRKCSTEKCLTDILYLYLWQNIAENWFRKTFHVWSQLCLILAGLPFNFLVTLLARCEEDHWENQAKLIKPKSVFLFLTNTWELSLDIWPKVNWQQTEMWPKQKWKSAWRSRTLGWESETDSPPPVHFPRSLTPTRKSRTRQEEAGVRPTGCRSCWFSC